jgi:hypothetical protein
MNTPEQLLQAPLTIYVDEAGSPDFTEVAAGGKLKAYVPCAVAVPNLAASSMLRCLPRSSSGTLLKSSDQALSEAQVVDFLTYLLASDCDVAAILIDPGGAESISVAHKGATLSSARRQAVHHAKISAASLGYSLLATQAIVNALTLTTERKGQLPTYVDVVLDAANIPRRHQRHFAQFLRKASEPRVRFGRIEWAHEDSEPLLLLPDLVAGVLHRQGTVGDVRDSCRMIIKAAKAGRVSLQDGHKIRTEQDNTTETRVPGTAAVAVPTLPGREPEDGQQEGSTC